ncbi:MULTISPECIES: hypothetical protein [Flavobacterium]|uniref:Uncharacterized protein n=1 Tax=Flavobacterium jumunjinense TaxID=998845 RepID=A0ABV5GQ35_9FLAO|nr:MULTISPECIES: hypothetical protein [Flavobacterium]
MDKKQTSLLIEFAKKLKKEATDSELAKKTLSSAGILNPQGKISKTYPNLKRILSVAQ